MTADPTIPEPAGPSVAEVLSEVRTALLEMREFDCRRCSAPLTYARIVDPAVAIIDRLAALAPAREPGEVEPGPYMIDEDGDRWVPCPNPHCEGYGCERCKYGRGWVEDDTRSEPGSVSYNVIEMTPDEILGGTRSEPTEGGACPTGCSTPLGRINDDLLGCSTCDSLYRVTRSEP
jgi:hypothetical protein